MKRRPRYEWTVATGYGRPSSRISCELPLTTAGRASVPVITSKVQAVADRLGVDPNDVITAVRECAGGDLRIGNGKLRVN